MRKEEEEEEEKAEEAEDNPFSFKKFAAPTEQRREKQGGDEAKGGAFLGSETGDEDQEAASAENPFSFKNFKTQEGHKQQKKAEPELPSLSDHDNDSFDEEDQDKDTVSGNKANPYSFKAFASSPSPSSSQASMGKPSAASSTLPLPAISTSEEEDEEEIGIPSLPMEGNLQDLYFSESHEQHSAKRGASSDSSSEALMRAQIDELKSQLRRAEAAAKEEQKRASAIERRALKAEKAHARLRKKEEEDTNQLNDVVQAIEHNLMLATARADKAEARVLELEKQLSNCSCGKGGSSNGPDADGAQQLKTINEQCRYLNTRLHKAASDAEAGIKSLMGGAAILRDMAAVLQGIDKLSHVDS